MPLPKPENGLVISYSYLWRNEYSAGKLEGLKNRPCALILVVENNEAEQIVTLLHPLLIQHLKILMSPLKYHLK